MLNSLASGRRLALRIVMWQLAVSVLTGLVFLLQGRREALAALAGALIVAFGNLLLTTRSFAGVHGAGRALAGLLTGMVLKWIAVVGGLVMILGVWKLPPLAALTGLMAAYAVNLLAFRFKG